SNPLQAGSETTPWHDVFDLDRGHVRYFGDHRSDTAGPLGSTKGNAALLDTFAAHQAGTEERRVLAAPLVLYRSVRRNGQSKGYLEFCGLGVIERAQKVDLQSPGDGAPFPNYEYDIALLDLSPEDDHFDWKWINARRDRTLTAEDTLELAPASWRTWVKVGNSALPDLRRETSSVNNRTDDQPRAQRSIAVRSPDWAWDELILACALVHRNGWHEVKKYDPRALELSDLLQRLPLHPPEARGEDFRNPNSIQRKTADLVTAQPDYSLGRTKGGRLTVRVVDEFRSRPEEMLAAADQIMSALTSDDPALRASIAAPSPDENDASAREGRTLERVHRYRERSPDLRKKKLDVVLRSGGTLACETCGFNFAQHYGTHGKGFIEVHHVVPLHEVGESVTSLDDLAVLCANCHRMCHRRLEDTGTWPSPSDLRELIRSRPN
ncbi:MAG: 5-methylcytosine-specific restriction enzyme, partial [Streptosporangiaceae bacterium]|nr:5-methylcytosine-specific restriction enzyme [Streptosporangiaceae bacterium]